MKAVKFKQANMNWAEGQEEYNTLPAYAGDTEQGRISVHCFQLSDAEVRNIVVNRRIWHRALTFGGGLQPFNIFAVKDFFTADEVEEYPENDDIAELEPNRYTVMKDLPKIGFWDRVMLLFGYRSYVSISVKIKGMVLERPEIEIDGYMVDEGDS